MQENRYKWIPKPDIVIEMSSMEYVTSFMKSTLSNRKVIQMLPLQRKIWKGNYPIIKLVLYFNYHFNSCN